MPRPGLSNPPLADTNAQRNVTSLKAIPIAPIFMIHPFTIALASTPAITQLHQNLQLSLLLRTSSHHLSPLSAIISFYFHTIHRLVLHLPQSTNQTESPHASDFISQHYPVQPPNFLHTWLHFLKHRNAAASTSIQASLPRAISLAHCHNPAPFWWLFLHLELLLFHPTSSSNRDDESIQSTIADRLIAFKDGRIEELWTSAMAIVSKSSTTSPPTNSQSNKAIQHAADSDNLRAAYQREPAAVNKKPPSPPPMKTSSMICTSHHIHHSMQQISPHHLKHHRSTISQGTSAKLS